MSAEKIWKVTNMYDSKSKNAEDFINDEEITATLKWAYENKDNLELLDDILEKAKEAKGISYKEAAALLCCTDEKTIEKMFHIATDIKQKIYGNRIVLFAPLYLSNYCVNGCVYCSYHNGNCEIKRKKLSQEEIEKEVIALQDMGHKRLALETGEDPVNSPIEYVLESIKTIYGIKHKNGAIRRVNVNIAATTVENYKKLKDAGIGTYILFQETYHKPTYEKVHPKGPKHNYAYHTEAMDRAMQGGIDDVGVGALFGLYDFKYDFVGILLHAKHLEDTYGVGPHTVSIPRIRPAEGVDISEVSKGVSDEDFMKITAILRLALPYTGIIVSTRESKELRSKLITLGVSQISGGSCTGVGGYCEDANEEKGVTSQFEVNDTRSLDEVIEWLCEDGYIPSFCTACYREGRTGDRFMSLAKTAQIGNVCQANALLTLQEYLEDYARPVTVEKAKEVMAKELEKIPSEKRREKVLEYIEKIKEGERDFRF